MAVSPLTISCDDCAYDRTSTCEDCVVSYLLGRGPDDAVIIDAEEIRAVKLLESAGLLPGLRHRKRAS